MNDVMLIMWTCGLHAYEFHRTGDSWRASYAWTETYFFNIKKSI